MAEPPQNIHNASDIQEQTHDTVDDIFNQGIIAEYLDGEQTPEPEQASEVGDCETISAELDLKAVADDNLAGPACAQPAQSRDVGDHCGILTAAAAMQAFGALLTHGLFGGIVCARFVEEVAALGFASMSVSLTTC